MTNSNSGKEKPNITLIVMCIVWCLVFLVFIGLFYNYMRTARAKSRFNNDVLKVSDLSELGFINPYKDHHNKGTAYYEEGDMESAEEEFRKALASRHDEESKDDCAMRIDLALSMVKPLTPESINADNVDLAIEILKEARSILCTNGWADMDNINYKSNDAQTLKEEIDEYIKQLEEQKEQQQQQQDPDNNSGGGGGGGGDSQTDPDDGGDDENNDSDPNEDLLDQLDDIMQDGQYDRSDIDNEKEYYNYEYYGGKSW